MLVASHSSGDQLIKKTASGICHPPESQWYDQTQRYEPFKSISACLRSGGGLPQGVNLAVTSNQRTSISEYDRSAFGGGWGDIDGDCQNSRAEALISTSTTKVRFAEEDKCRVITGRWISPFSGAVIQNASDIDIDHVVPLHWAWDHGANEWSSEKRERFANDPVNLWPVEASLNRSKGAKGPDEWLPPQGECQYTARFLRLTKLYGLHISVTEQASYRRTISSCMD